MEQHQKNRKHRLCGDSVDNGFERVISLFARQFWPVLGTARQEVLGWDGVRAAGLAWGGDWGGGVGWGRGGQREEGFGWERAQEHGSYLLTWAR